MANAIKEAAEKIRETAENVSTEKDTAATNKSTSNETESSTLDTEALSEVIDTKKMADELGIDESVIIDDMNMTELEKQQSPYLKTDLSDQETIIEEDGQRLDNVDTDSEEEVLDGVTVSAKKDLFGNITNHIESDYLGSFDYDPDEFALGYKEVTEKDGSVSKLPVLSYIGNNTGMTELVGGYVLWGNGDIKIPDGLKVADYMFANNENLKYAPKLPDSLTSMHCMFLNCKNMKEPCTGAYAMPSEHVANFANWYAMPSKVEDMSSAFKGCSNFTTGFPDEMPETLVNLTDTWYGCDKIGKTVNAWYTFGQDCTFRIPGYGGTKTPYVTSAYAKGALDDIPQENVKEYADNVDYVVDEDGRINEEYKDEVESGIADGTIDEEKLEESQAATGLEYADDALNGTTESEVEIASNGARTKNKVYNAETDSYEYDETGELRSDPTPQGSLWQRLVIDGAAGLGIGGLVRGVTGSKWLGIAAGVGGAALLDYANVLPESFAPILKFTANILPEGDLKNKVLELYEKSGGVESEIAAQKEYWSNDRVAEAHADERMESSLKYVSYGNIMKDDSLVDAMTNNGKLAATSGALWATARQGENGTAIAGVKEYVALCTSNVEATWASQLGDSKELTEDMKAQMSGYYESMLSALGSYNEGAQSGIKSSYTWGSTRYDLATEGLNMANRAYVEQVMESMKRMESQYGVTLLTDEKLNELSSSISGVGQLSEYSAESFDNLRTETELNVDSLVSMDDLDYAEYDGDYEGTSRLADDEPVDETTESAEKTSKEVTDEKIVKSEPDTTKTIDKDSVSKKSLSRGAQAESQLGVTGDELDTEVTGEYEHGGGGGSF